MSEKKVACTTKSLVNATRDLRLECARVLYECFFVPVLMYESERGLEGEGRVLD